MREAKVLYARSKSSVYVQQKFSIRAAITVPSRTRTYIIYKVYARQAIWAEWRCGRLV